MLKHHWRLISFLERIGDNLIVIGSFFLSYSYRDEIAHLLGTAGMPLPRTLLMLGPIEDYLIVLGLALPFFNAFISVLGGYKSMRLSSFWQLLHLCVLSTGLVLLCESSMLYLLKLDLSRSFVATFCVLSGIGIFIERIFVLRLLRYFRVKGLNFRNVLIVGTGPAARRVYTEILRQQELGLRVVGFIDVHRTDDAVPASEEPPLVLEPAIDGALTLDESLPHLAPTRGTSYSSAVFDLPVRVIATAEGFETALKRHAVDEVLFTDVVENFKVFKGLAHIAVEEGVKVTFAADLFSLEIFRSDVSYFGNIPLIHYHPSAGGADSVALLVKRMIDATISFVALLVLSPFLVAVALAIKITSPGPVFFTQRRVGLNGRHFTLLKFRSMVVGAEKLLPQLREQNEMTGPVFKLRDDPRVTTLGRFLRRYSIDELPQLINVLRGDMSLVGPRPPLPEEVSLYLRKHRKRLSMRPGLTCIWQVSGRNNIPDFERWAQLDLEYIDNWSLFTDLKLLMRTIPVVLSGAGAR